VNGPSHVRHTVVVGEGDLAFADVPRSESPERVRQLLQNQLLINARQGGDGLPRGWLALLPDDLGPGVSGRLKEELMELRDQIDNIEHALGLPARYWSGADQECDADLTDAEREALNASEALVITDRAKLMLDPGEQDSCTDYSVEPQARDCDDDGHYLCEGCGRFNRERRARDFDVDNG
jgi:hypothetical protein